MNDGSEGFVGSGGEQKGGGIWCLLVRSRPLACFNSSCGNGPLREGGCCMVVYQGMCFNKSSIWMFRAYGGFGGALILLPLS